MGEFGLGLDLPDEVFEHPLIQAMENAANDVVVLGNVSRSQQWIFRWLLKESTGHLLIQSRDSNASNMQYHQRSDAGKEYRLAGCDG